MIFATVPALRAMSCQKNKFNGLSLQAEYDNVEFYRTAIQNMQQEILLKPVQSSQEKQLPNLLRAPNVGYTQDLPHASYAVWTPFSSSFVLQQIRI